MASEGDAKKDLKTFEGYVEKLLKQAVPDNNARRYHEYVKYINAFTKWFGQEQAMVAGSTAEVTKLRTDKCDGDADFLLISGAAKIPEKLLVFREKTPGFVWIEGQSLQHVLSVPLIEGKYVPSSVLREVGPDLFSLLRGFYKVVTSTSDTVPGSNSRVVTTGEAMKVGLARYEYRNFEVDESILPPKSRVCKYIRQSGSTAKKQKIEDKDKDGMATMRKLVEAVASMSVPGNAGSHDGQFLHFAHILKLLLREEEDEATTLENPVEASITDDISEVRYENDLDAVSEEKIMASCSSYTSKDFVPALRVSETLSRLKCTQGWSTRERNWPTENVIQEICDTTVFVVAKQASVYPAVDRDFCLSFNMAEILLAKALSSVQRKCVLILKAYNLGVLKDVTAKQKELERIMERKETTKLTTFHLKTALYRVIEMSDPQLWQEDRLVEAVITVVRFIIDALERCELEHYFIKRNLFAGMEIDYRNDMKAAFKSIEEDPVGNIKSFLEREDCFGKEPVSVEISEEAVMGLLEIAEDGGRKNEVRRVKDAMVDFKRGFELGPKNAEGVPPVREALNHVIKVFLEDEMRNAMQRALEKMNNSSTGSPLLAQRQSAGGSDLDRGKALAASVTAYLNSTDEKNKKKHLDELKFKGASFFLGKPS